MREECIRKAIEVALQSARKMQNKESGFVHVENGVPFFENCLFCLALFRTKTHESMQEAKILLDRLLYFQQKDPHLPSQGNYPVYLHDYPYCRDHYLAAKAAHALTLIQREFSQILGDSLRERLQTSLGLATCFAQELSKKEALPLWMQVKIAALTGDWQFVDPSLMREQDYQADAVGHMLASFYMTADSLEDNWLWRYVVDTYHVPSRSYGGPAFRHLQKEFHQKISLYDYMLGMLSDSMPSHCLVPQEAALQAALTVSCSDTLHDHINRKVDGVCGSLSWHVQHEEAFVLSWIDEHPAVSTQPGFYPCLLQIDGKAMTLNIQKGKVFCKATSSGICCDIAFDPECFQTETERKKVLSFAMPSDGLQFFVEGVAASTFALGETITIRSSTRVMTVQFEALDGDVRFFGNIGPTNRPDNCKSTASVKLQQPLEMQMYDKELALRHLTGTHATVRMKITV